MSVSFTIERTGPMIQAAFTLQVLHQSDLEASVPALGRMAQSAAIIDRLEDLQPNTIKIISGDAWLPGPFYAAEGDAAVQTALRTFYNSPVQGGGSTRASIAYMNAIGTNVASFGNHEFDAGTAQISDGIRRTTNATGGVTNAGATFPYLSANYDFGADPNLRTLVSPDGQEASSVPGRIAGSAVVTLNGERVGVVGVTTQILASISSPGFVVGRTPNIDDVQALASVTQPYIDALRAQGINKIIVSSHLQQYQLETALVPLLSGVDIIISGGSHVLFADSNDTLRPGDTPVQTYPLQLADRDGNPVLQLQTQNEYSYVGRLVVGFDANGVLLPGSVDRAVSGNVVTTDASVAALYGTADPYAAGSKGAQVRGLTDAVGGVIRAKDGTILGFTDVFLNGNRTDVRNEETNLGDVSADANLLVARQVDPTVAVSIKNAGGIRDVIGSFSTDALARPIPPAANPDANKPSGAVSQLDIENSLRFNNALSLVTVSAQDLARLVEHGVAAVAPGTTPGQFPQVGGISFSFDPARTAQVTNAAGVVTTAGERVRNLAILNADGGVADVLVRDGVIQGDPARPIRTVTLNFLADGGDGYRFNVYGSNRVDLLNNPALADGAATFAAKGSEQDAIAEYLRAVAPTAAQALTAADTLRSGDQRIQNLASRPDSALLGLLPQNLVDALSAQPGLVNRLTAQAAALGPINVVNAADAASLAAPLTGRTNVAQITPATAGATNVLPTGFQAGVLAGTNAGALTVSAANSLLVGNAAASVLTSNGGSSALVAGSGSTSLLANGAGNIVTGGVGNDSMAGGGTFFTGAGRNLVSLNETGSTVRAEGQDTIFAGLAGPATDVVGATDGSGGTVVFAGGGRLTFVNAGASSTVAGGAGSSTVFGGAGGGVFQGGSAGGNVLLGQGGAVTLFGGGNGDLLYADSTAQSILVAGPGNSTLVGGASSGATVFVAGAGAGTQTTVQGGGGNDIVFANTGSLVADGGSGVDLFVFTSDRPGGTSVINGFTVGQDRLALLGFGAGEAGRALAAAEVAGGSTTLTLVDNTRVTFTGVTNLSSRVFV